MRKFIVNADDFGLHEEINKGIIYGYQNGIITSTSLMCSAPAFSDAVALAKANDGLGIGIHLTLVGGVKTVLPQEKLATLVDADGRLPADYISFSKKFYTGGIRLAEIEAELRAQIERALTSSVNVTHVDSHQHTHVLPGIGALVLKLCSEYNIKKVRVPGENIFFKGGFNAGAFRHIGRCGLTACAYVFSLQAQKFGCLFPRHFFGMLAGGNLNTELVGRIIASIPDGVSELMIHPGMGQSVLQKEFSWGYNWGNELQACLAMLNKDLLAQRGIKMINFGDIADE